MPSGPVTPPGGPTPYVPGSDRIIVQANTLTIPHDVQTAIDWSHGSPFIFKVGTALDTVGADVVFVTAGLYAVQVHLPHGVADSNDANAHLKADLLLACGTQNADGDDAWSPAIATNADAVGHQGAISTSYVWTQAAGATLQASITCTGAHDGLVESVVCQIVKLSNVAPDS